MNKLQVITAILLATVCWNAMAQIDMGMANIAQNDHPVGMVWVPEVTDTCEYVEYWYLGPDYVYPNSIGVGESEDTVIRPIGDIYQFAGVAAFFRFARDQFPGGKRLIVSTLELERCGSAFVGD